MRRAKFHILAILLTTMMVLAVAAVFAVPALALDAPSGITIQITPPTGWTNRDANVSIAITDTTGSGFERAMVKGEGNWRDITAELEQRGRQYDTVMTVSDNCTVTVSVTGWDGQTYEASRYVGCFDKEAPALKTSFTGKALHVEATDTASGVAAVYVGGRMYAAPANGAVDVPLTELGTAQKVSVQAEDNAGNRSQAVSVAIPNDKTSQPDSTPKPAAPTVTAKPAVSTPATPTKTEDTSGDTSAKEPDGDASSGTPLTPDGNMSLSDDISSAPPEEKQFITVTTKNGNYFYLIIDRADDGENTVHFLNQVDEADLLALMEDGTVTPAVCSCSDKCKAGAVNTACELCAVDMTECVGKEPPPEPDPEPDPDPEPEPEPKKGDKNGLLVIVLAVALAGGGAVYFLKFKKNKPDTKGSADLDDYDYGDEEDEETEDEDA